jgi:hypothetical protein
LFVLQTWHPHYFGLTETQLHYTGETNTEEQEDEEQEEGPELNGIAEVKIIRFLVVRVSRMRAI